MQYTLIRSKRKTISIEINENCQIIVRAPLRMTDRAIDKFVNEKSGWIEKALVKMENRRNTKKQYSDDDVKLLYLKAREILPTRLEYWSKITGFTPTGVKITTAKKRFGSCSPKNSLCFSVFLFDYPMPAIDYVIVHELCHIKEHNHSARFWREVEKILPDYKQRQKLLK